jgi:hypothetical protein
MRRDGFVELRWFPTAAAAQIARSLLETEGIDCLIDPSEPLATALASGTRGVRLHVPESVRTRALVLLRETELSERELTFLATRRLPEPAEE